MTNDKSEPANILQALLAVQGRQGYVPPSAVPGIAAALKAPEAAVAGVLSSYPALRTTPPARHRIGVCVGESCVANHCERLLAVLRDRLQIELGQTTRDGGVSLERVYCLGNCAVAPTVLVDDEIHGRMTPELLQRKLSAFSCQLFPKLKAVR